MTEEAEVAPEATIEAVPVSQEAASEATENTEGQPEGPPTGSGEEKPRETSEERRARRKAYDQKLREDAEAARREAKTERSRSERILASTGEPPKESEFADPFEYAAALGAYKARQSGAQHDARFMNDDATAAEQRANDAEGRRLELRLDAFRDQADEAKKIYADFDRVVAIAADPRFVSPALSEMVLDSEQAADLAYHLGKNPALALNLSQMPPLMAARELGRIEATLSVPKPKTQTNAPSPISPVNGRGGKPTKSAEEMTLAEFVAWRESGGTPTKG